MVCTVNDIIGILESLAPTGMAEEWDNAGLLCGDRADRVKNVMVTLDVNDDVIEEAVDLGINMIVSHHPLTIEKIGKVTSDTYTGELFRKLIKYNIALYSAHTNLDRVAGGVNDALCEALGLRNVTVLEPAYVYPYRKLVTYVPTAYEDAVAEAMCEAGAGTVGKYTDCTFRTAGTGTYTGTEEDEGFSEVGELTRTEETRIEATVAVDRIDEVCEAIRQMHPYEEPIIDVFEMKAPRTVYGTGRVGDLEESMTFNDFVNKVADALETKTLRVAGQPDLPVKRIAVVGGSGSDYFPLAINAGAQVFLTADVKRWKPVITDCSWWTRGITPANA